MMQIMTTPPICSNFGANIEKDFNIRMCGAPAATNQSVFHEPWKQRACAPYADPLAYGAQPSLPTSGQFSTPNTPSEFLRQNAIHSCDAHAHPKFESPPSIPSSSLTPDTNGSQHFVAPVKASCSQGLYPDPDSEYYMDDFDENSSLSWIETMSKDETKSVGGDIVAPWVNGLERNAQGMSAWEDNDKIQVPDMLPPKNSTLKTNMNKLISKDMSDSRGKKAKHKEKDISGPNHGSNLSKNMTYSMLPPTTPKDNDLLPPDKNDMPPPNYRRLKGKPMSGPWGDEGKRKHFLQRNRVAAMKCRKKKKEWVSDLEETKSGLEHQNALLHMELNGLVEEASRIRAQLMAHAGCGDENINKWLENEAKKFVIGTGKHYDQILARFSPPHGRDEPQPDGGLSSATGPLIASAGLSPSSMIAPAEYAAATSGGPNLNSPLTSTPFQNSLTPHHGDPSSAFYDPNGQPALNTPGFSFPPGSSLDHFPQRFDQSLGVDDEPDYDGLSISLYDSPVT